MCVGREGGREGGRVHMHHVCLENQGIRICSILLTVEYSTEQVVQKQL